MKEKGRGVVIVVVEGQTDRVYLENPLKQIFCKDNQVVLFIVVGHDLTSDKKSAPDNIVEKLESYILNGMEKQGLNLNDISQVLQITDLDGAYIADSAIHVVPEDERMEIPTYLPEGIYAKKSSQIAKRNARKRENIGFLLQQNFILTDEIPYALGYMSHNTECVFLVPAVYQNHPK